MFEPERDEAFHLGGRQPGSLGLDLHGRGSEVWQRIALHVAKVPDAERDHDEGVCQDDPPGLDTRRKKPSHHGRAPPIFAAQIRPDYTSSDTRIRDAERATRPPSG